MFKSRFRVRIVHHSEDKYEVQYTTSIVGLIINWARLMWYYDFSSNNRGWSVNLWKFQDAEKIAFSLKSEADVAEYYKVWEAKEKNCDGKYEKISKEVAPYKIKNIL